MNKYVTKLAGCCATEICLYPPSALSTGFSVHVNVDVRNKNSSPYLIKLWGHNFCPIQVWPPVLNMPDKRIKLMLKLEKDFFLMWSYWEEESIDQHTPHVCLRGPEVRSKFTKKATDFYI